MVRAKTAEEIEEARRVSDASYRFAMKALALVGGVATLVTLPLIAVIYGQMDRRQSAQEARQERSDTRFYEFQAQQSGIITKDRMIKFEDALGAIVTRLTNIEVSMAAQGTVAKARENQYQSRQLKYAERGGK